MFEIKEIRGREGDDPRRWRVERAGGAIDVFEGRLVIADGALMIVKVDADGIVSAVGWPLRMINAFGAVADRG